MWQCEDCFQKLDEFPCMKISLWENHFGFTSVSNTQHQKEHKYQKEWTHNGSTTNVLLIETLWNPKSRNTSKWKYRRTIKKEGTPTSAPILEERRLDGACCTAGRVIMKKTSISYVPHVTIFLKIIFCGYEFARVSNFARVNNGRISQWKPK